MRFDHTGTMLRRSLFLLPFVLLAACSDSDSSAVDTTQDADYGDGPTTYRPDDGVDTGTEETTADAATEASSEASTDGSTSDATGDASETATDAGPMGLAAARLNEVFVDRNLAGDATEFVEISGPEGIALDKLRLRAVKPDGSIAFDVAVGDSGAKMPASGLWVVGGLASSADKTYSITGPANWGIPSDSGAIQLTRTDGVAIELLDVVAYGVAPMTPTTEPKTVVEDVPAALPPSGSTNKSIGRKSVPGNTDHNGNDFCVQTASPKAANGACL